MKTNIILHDMPFDEKWDFRLGLEEVTGEKWSIRNCVTNAGRSKLYEVYRYTMYFYFPFKVFLKRKKYDKIVSWQAFYGILFAFYCRLFGVKKQNYVLIKNFTYKPKGGGDNSIFGRFYYRWMRYIVKSPYIDKFVCTSQTFCDYCSEQFDEPIDRFVYIPFGVEDFTKDFTKEDLLSKEDYILSLGRSNRDWQWLIDSLKETKYKVKIICDKLHVDNPPTNINIINNVSGKEAHKYIARCKMMIIPIKDGKIGSGETVLLKAMSFGVPLIINRPSCLADDYIEDEETGLVVNKNKEELRAAVKRLYEDTVLYEKLSKQERDTYLEKHSIFSYGKYIGKVVND